MVKGWLGHAALACHDPREQARFYRELFAMQLVGGSPNGETAFICGRVDEESHEIAFFQAQPGLHHLAFRVASPEELLAAYQAVKARGIALQHSFNHGVSLAIYFPDPEGNLIEVYWATDRHDYTLPYAEPFDFEGKSGDDLRRFVREMAAPVSRS
ncbi:MAG TPA: VOC family protein [Dictyobacter sp.]|jgi:catechol-2,3-dioxygenase|nr:VOC family protein [Dictyobacter sp.]